MNDLPFGQADLVSAILLYIDRRGVAGLNVRQMNAVIAAADDIMTELYRPHAKPAPGCGLGNWLASDETGLSSRYLARALAPLLGTGARVPDESLHWRDRHHPHDPSDFGRCVGLLDSVPELRPHLGAMAQEHGPAWAGLVAAWDELEALYREELPTGKAPRLYERMRAILDAAEKEEQTRAD